MVDPKNILFITMHSRAWIHSFIHSFRPFL